MADPIMGYQTYGEYTVENTWGTTPANPVMKWFGGVQDIVLKPKEDKFEEIHLKGSSATQHRHLDNIVNGLKSCDLQVMFHPQVIGGGYDWSDLLDLVMGSNLAYTDAIPSFTLNRVTAGYSFVALGARVNRFSIKASKGELMSWEMDAMAERMTTTPVTMGAGSHASDPGTLPLTWINCSTIVNSVPQVNVREIDFTLDNGLVSEPRIRATDPNRPAFIKPGKFGIKGSLTWDFIDQTLLGLFQGGAYVPLTVTIDTKTFTFTDAKFSDVVSYDTKPEDLIGEKIPFTARLVATN